MAVLIDSDDSPSLGKARVKSRANRNNRGYSWSQGSMVYCSLVMLLTIANAIVNPIESPNGIDAGNINPMIDPNGLSGADNVPKPSGNQNNGGLSMMDVMAVISVTILSFLVYLFTQNPRSRQINLGISLLAATWIHWTVLIGDGTIFLFSIVWTYNMGNTLALLFLEVSTLESGLIYVVVVILVGTAVDGILTFYILPIHDVGFMAVLPHSIAASMIIAGIVYRLGRLIKNALTKETRDRWDELIRYRPTPGRRPE